MMTATDLQSTLLGPFSASGPGLHTGRGARVIARPAPPDHGITISVLSAGASEVVRPCWRSRVPSRMNTALALDGRRKLRTIEHFMASMSAFGVDNASVEIRGEEFPIFDGSADTWCRLIAKAGVCNQSVPRQFLRVLRPIQVRHFEGFIRVEPQAELSLDVSTDQLPGFGVLAWRGAITRDVFLRELSRSRSFGRLSRGLDEVLRGFGFTGGTQARDSGQLLRQAEGKDFRATANRPQDDGPGELPANLRVGMRCTEREPVLRGALPGRVAIVVGRHIIGGARYPDEPVRHKALDLFGDLALAGAPLLGRVIAHRPTHALAHAFVSVLMDTPSAWEFTAT